VTDASEEHRVRVRTEGDAAEAARIARELALRHGLTATEAVHVATAVSEVAANQVRHADDGGTVVVSRSPAGVRVEAADGGPGIADVELALRDGWSTDGGLGLGLPGARRLMDGFELTSEQGSGTVVRMTKLVQPVPSPVAVWSAVGGQGAAEAVAEATATRLLLGVMTASAAKRARADPIAASEDLAETLGGTRGVVAQLSGRDGTLSWLSCGGAAGVLLRGPKTSRRPVATAPTRRAAEVGVLRDDVLLLSIAAPELDRMLAADLDTLAAEAARATRDTAIAARVLRGVLERPDRRPAPRVR
jgi:anti-sigma regulatory factor (Ser/Thr protein kinase)